MKGWIILILVITITNLISGVRINEIEANPLGSDSGNEWIELYSEVETSVDGWKIMRSDNKEQNISGNFTGYYTINISTQWITNSLESIYLIDKNNSVISFFLSFNDSENNDKTWQYCDAGWIFINHTRPGENACQTTNNNGTNVTNQTTNQTSNQTINQTIPSTNNTTNQSQESNDLQIKIQTYTITNGEEEDLMIEMINLENSIYGIKISIEDSDGEILSEINNEGKWTSSFYYIEDFAVGPGSINKTALIRIKKDYSDLEGEYSLIIRLRKKGASSYKEIKQRIIIQPMIIDDTKEDDNLENISYESEEENKEDKGAVYLNYDDSKSIKSNVLYESNNQRVRNYLPYILATICVIIITFLLINRRRYD